ncbi:MAG: S-layer family protein, partial [Moorea sp. SIO3C2]|nr:S-layer family protein [Moorena sp. SIO3C2]
SSSSAGTGNAGDITIHAQDQVLFDGTTPDGQVASGALSQVEVDSRGQGGDVNILTDRLTVTNGARLSSTTAGQGDAGDVVVAVREQAVFSGMSMDGQFTSGALSQVESRATGMGGDVQISGPVLEILDGAQLNASTDGNGAAGDVIVDGREVRLNEGLIAVESMSGSAAGTMRLQSDRVILEDNSLISAESDTVDGGEIFLMLDHLLLMRNGSGISATAGNDQAGGNGGNVNIRVPFIVAIRDENSDITANAFAGSGGRVFIMARGVFGLEPRPELTGLSDITASSERGPIGIIELNNIDSSFVQNSLVELPDDLIDSDVLVADSCVARYQDTESTFTIVGSSLPEGPAVSTGESYSVGTVQAVGDGAEGSDWELGDEIQEPTGVYALADGRLVMGQECS